MKRKCFQCKPQPETLVTLLALIGAILVNALANCFKGSLFVLFYQGVLVLGICIFFPLYYIQNIKKESLNEIGLTTKGWFFALLVGLIFAAVSVPGQIIHKTILFPSFDKLVYVTIALMMSALFEELFFRGFLQTRFEKAFGIIPAVLLSGAAFSLYHLGYPKFRSVELLLMLFFVGTFLAISFSITKNVITSFTVNLPNAIITYIINPQQFTDFNKVVAIISFSTICIAIVIISLFKIKETRNQAPAMTG